MRHAALAFAVLLIVGVSLGAMSATSAQSDPASDVAVDEHAEPSLVHSIQLTPEGDAHWNVTMRFPTETDEQADAFAALEADIEEEGLETYLPIEPYAMAATQIGEEVDRSMRIEGVEREIIHGNQTGIVSMTFVWTEFSRATEHRVIVGDAFAATGQTWLATLDHNEHIRIHGPPNYTVESSGMPVQNGTMWLSGPADLSDQHLSGTFIAPGHQTSPSNGSTIPGLIGGVLIGLTTLALLLVMAAYLDRPSLARALDGMKIGEESATEDETEEESESQDVEASDPLGDRELLSDEELVESLIEHHGGRMKQAQIVTETDWSNAKVSQLLSQMAEDGDVEKLRIGRENLISLSEHDE